MKLTKKCAALAAGLMIAAGIAPPTATAQSSAGLFDSLSSLSSAIANSLPDDVPTAPSTGASRNEERYVNGRSYVARIPAGYNADRNYPVVIGMPGWQHSVETFRSYAGFDAEVGSEAIVVYPRAINLAWGGAPYASTSVSQDADFLRAMINDLGNAYSINKNKVFAMGLSNGGGMALALACKAPDLVAGVASVAGAYYNPTTGGCSSTPVPTLIMHGTNDDTVGINGGVRHNAPYRSVDYVFRQFQGKNDCAVTGTSVPGAIGFNTTTFNSIGCKADTTFIRVDGGTHTWFPSNPSAQQEAWKFFRAQL